jgi:hypothetical protein
MVYSILKEDMKLDECGWSDLLFLAKVQPYKSVLPRHHVSNFVACAVDAVRTNQPLVTSQQYFYLRTNQHQP